MDFNFNLLHAFWYRVFNVYNSELDDFFQYVQGPLSFHGLYKALNFRN